MKLHGVRSALCAYTFPLYQRPMVMQRCERLLNRVRDKLWRGRGATAIEILRTLIVSLQLEIGSLPLFYGLGARTASSAAARLLTFLVNNRSDLIDHQQVRMIGRRVSSASAESVMNHLINRRLTKRQQIRWSMKGAHYLLQTRVELLDGRLEAYFAKRLPHFRSPEIARQCIPSPTFCPLPVTTDGNSSCDHASSDGTRRSRAASTLTILRHRAPALARSPG